MAPTRSSVGHVLGLVALLSSCGDATVDHPDGATPADAAAPDDGVASDAGAGPDAGAEPDAAAGSVAVRTEVVLPGHPHTIDLYVPSNAERVIVFLHGGGGTKAGGAAHESGVRLDDPPGATPVPDAAWLLATRTAWVFPQGQHVASAPRAATWSNYVMTSGVDDVAFLSDLAAAVRAGTLDPALPALSRVYLAGHSNGGMMTARVWCESTATFDGYGALSGPPSVELLATGPHPCHASVERPYLSVLGGADTILQTAGNWSGPWAINSCLSSGGGGAVVDAALADEEPFEATRAMGVCGGSVSAPTTTPVATTWTDCAGRAQLIRVDAADHCVAAGTVPCLDDRLVGGPCTNSLDASYGTRMRDVLTSFFVATE